MSFPADDVTDIIKTVITEVIPKTESYMADMVDEWASTIDEKVLWNLSKLNMPFKYITTCTIMQKNGAGIQSSASCYWDNTSDGSCTIRWENNCMYCIVTVFGLII
ncbi:dynein light chain Tctex-type 1-like [Stegodyphus dumicola]|uniref:dynein light chain Tctex-type 1-like n=1 Tax=Stegodyphus dumicola TaxID=202533 RepID=UPI0015AE20EF|nr:dynein light chain Tctex-type 1-like [Stegodyphus dumicola]